MIKQFYYKNNRLQQLKGFYYTVQTGSISGCAKKLGLTQAAVSMQIKSLERDLGIQLFNREKKRIKLTNNGKEFYLQSLQYVQGLEDLFESAARFFKGKDSNTLKIGANHVSICYILPKYLKEFRKQNPSTKIKIENLAKDIGIERLINNEIDFLIYPMNQLEIPNELEFRNIINYHPIVLINKKNELSKKKTISFKDLKGHDLIRIDPKLITLPFFEKVIKDNNLSSSIEFEMADWEILKKFVKANIGVALISNIIMEGEPENSTIKAVKLEQYSDITMPYGMLTKKGKIFTPIQKDFINLFFQEQLKIENS